MKEKIKVIIAAFMFMASLFVMNSTPEVNASPPTLPAHIDNNKYEFVTGGDDNRYLLVGNTRTGELERVYYKEIGGKVWVLIKDK